jgi:2-phospho-L-lactate transferase/gluconeogenesis factor (CofD/UPF0052 family)
MTQPRETSGYTASMHVKALVEHTDPRVVDAVLVNSEPIPESIQARYREQDSVPVEPDIEKIHALGYRVITDNYCSFDSERVRHNADRVSKQIIQFIIGSRGWFIGNTANAEQETASEQTV